MFTGFFARIAAMWVKNARCSFLMIEKRYLQAK
jgi:hypothetical protein